MFAWGLKGRYDALYGGRIGTWLWIAVAGAGGVLRPRGDHWSLPVGLVRGCHRWGGGSCGRVFVRPGAGLDCSVADQERLGLGFAPHITMKNGRVDNKNGPSARA